MKQKYIKTHCESPTHKRSASQWNYLINMYKDPRTNHLKCEPLFDTHKVEEPVASDVGSEEKSAVLLPTSGNYLAGFDSLELQLKKLHAHIISITSRLMKAEEQLLKETRNDIVVNEELSTTLSPSSFEEQSDDEAEFSNEFESDGVVSFRNNSETESVDIVRSQNLEPDFGFKFRFEMKYDKSVEKILYPESLRNYFITISDTKYPIFRLDENGIACIICGNAISSASQHLLSEEHENRENDHALNMLKKFHDFWMNQEPHVQIEQKHFRMQGKNLECFLCDTDVFYEEVVQHIGSSQHKNFSSNPVKRSKNDVEMKSDLSEADDSAKPVASKVTPSPKSKTPSKKKESHEIRKAVSKPDSSDVLERLPERFKMHLPFLNILPNTFVFCKCCSESIVPDVFEISCHVRSKNHISKSELPFAKFQHFCEICIKIYSLEESWVKHLKSTDHLGRFNNLGKIRKDSMMEYECVTCSLVIFGDKLSLVRHQQSIKFPRRPVREQKLPESVKRLFKSVKHIDEIASELLLEANRESQDQERESRCCFALVDALKDAYQQCRAYPFGSRVTGLGNKGSDLDVFVDVNNMYWGTVLQEPEEQAMIVKDVAKILKKSKNVFSHINPVPTARTPIIQVYHIATGIDCDVSFRHGLSVENTALIRLCIDIQPKIQKVMLVLKMWYKLCNLNCFSSYALTMMVIYYLQTEGYLMSIKTLKTINPEFLIIDGWETIKYTASLPVMKSRVKCCELSVANLLYNFFVHYAKFDYEKYVICPLLGQTVLKAAFTNCGSRLPIEMISYVKKLQMNEDAEQFRSRCPMCIQDPFDLSHNLTKACERGSVSKWKTFCDLSAKHIISALH